MYIYFSYVCGQKRMCGMHICGGPRLMIGTFCITPLPYSLSQCLSGRTISYPSNSSLEPAWSGGLLSPPFKAAITGRPACLCCIYIGSWNMNLSFYVCRASACSAELSLQPGGTLCSNQIVTPATNNLISKDSCVPPLTLQVLLYSLEADIKCCCLVLPPCWKLHTQPCLWQLFGSWDVLIWDSRLALVFKGKNKHRETIIQWATEMAEWV